MEFLPVLGAIIAAVGFFGWSHKSLSSKIEALEGEIMARPDEAKVKEIIRDKLAPHVVEYAALTRRLDELKQDNAELARKIDKMMLLMQKIHGLS